jgi:hypothetical protein
MLRDQASHAVANQHRRLKKTPDELQYISCVVDD